MLQSALRGRYAVSTYTYMSNTARYSSGIAFLPTPPALDALRYRGSRRNISTPFGTEKLECWGYPMVKKIHRYVYSF